MSLRALKELVVTSGRQEYVTLQTEELLECLIDQIAKIKKISVSILNLVRDLVMLEHFDNERFD